MGGGTHFKVLGSLVTSVYVGILDVEVGVGVAKVTEYVPTRMPSELVTGILVVAVSDGPANALYMVDNGTCDVASVAPGDEQPSPPPPVGPAACE